MEPVKNQESIYILVFNNYLFKKSQRK